MDFEKKVKNSIEIIKDFGMKLELGRPCALKIPISIPQSPSKYWKRLDVNGNETKHYDVANSIFTLNYDNVHPYDIIVQNSEVNMLLDVYDGMWNLINIHPDYTIGCAFGIWNEKRMTVDMILRKKYRKKVDINLFKSGYELGKNIREYSDKLYENS